MRAITCSRWPSGMDSGSFGSNENLVFLLLLHASSRSCWPPSVRATHSRSFLDCALLISPNFCSDVSDGSSFESSLSWSSDCSVSFFSISFARSGRAGNGAEAEFWRLSLREAVRLVTVIRRFLMAGPSSRASERSALTMAERDPARFHPNSVHFPIIIIPFPPSNSPFAIAPSSPSKSSSPIICNSSLTWCGRFFADLTGVHGTVGQFWF
mmetsp:Transcript_40549/g.82905  ORF Transcript_40549/g.82905 Transcript_40549/m.82905 type:complete len:211 (+) Transcript_40549:720-1352(+)